MPDTLTYHNEAPKLLPLYARALSRKGGRGASDITLPELSARLVGAGTSTPALDRLQAICGAPQTRHLPITWPHLIAFPLHLRLLTDKQFPLPLLGLVHLRNTITQHRDIGRGEILDLSVRLGAQERTSRGIEFNLITEAYASGRLVWEESSVNLFRQPAREEGANKGKSAPPKLERYPNTLDVSAPEAIGRQYAAVSGDRNPIHMHALSAKAFGFPRAIAHGMWSKARVLALLQQQPGWQAGPVRVSCQFKKPLFLPGTAQLNWQPGTSGWDYQLLNAKGDAPHLSGRIDWL